MRTYLHIYTERQRLFYLSRHHEEVPISRKHYVRIESGYDSTLRITGSTWIARFLLLLYRSSPLPRAFPRSRCATSDYEMAWQGTTPFSPSYLSPARLQQVGESPGSRSPSSTLAHASRRRSKSHSFAKRPSTRSIPKF